MSGQETTVRINDERYTVRDGRVYHDVWGEQAELDPNGSLAGEAIARVRQQQEERGK